MQSFPRDDTLSGVVDQAGGAPAAGDSLPVMGSVLDSDDDLGSFLAGKFKCLGCCYRYTLNPRSLDCTYVT